MLPVEIIIKKRDHCELTRDEIGFFISGYVAGTITDYQAAAFLMASFLNGLNFDETAWLTEAMMNSGRTYDFLDISPMPVDKHSTGGVGDKVSLILAPLAAACGLVVPMVSGRGLGHTGGTLDKLESIPGFNVHIAPLSVKKQLSDIGVVMIGQDADFVPADKQLYALRDVTGTIENVPLLCSSILSKKLASGARGVVMDVKCGSGAFMPNLKGAKELAAGLKRVGERLGCRIECLISNMDEPLGRTVGNSLEVREAIDCLHGKGPADLRELTLKLCAAMIVMGGVISDRSKALEHAIRTLDSGAAWNRFVDIVRLQGGSVAAVDDPGKLKVSDAVWNLEAFRSGYVSEMNCRQIGQAALVLGAGRKSVADSVDPSVGLVMNVRIGDRVEVGQTLVEIYHRDRIGLDSAIDRLTSAITISDSIVLPPPLIYEEIA